MDATETTAQALARVRAEGIATKEMRLTAHASLEAYFTVTIEAKARALGYSGYLRWCQTEEGKADKNLGQTLWTHYWSLTQHEDALRRHYRSLRAQLFSEQQRASELAAQQTAPEQPTTPVAAGRKSHTR